MRADDIRLRRTEESAVTRLADVARDRLGAGDIVVNGAGRGRFGTFASTTGPEWQAEPALTSDPSYDEGLPAPASGE